jgi:hypothetical protein
MKLLVGIIFAATLTTPCPAQVPTQVDVCTVLQEPLSFRGALIAVRGIARSVKGLAVGSDMCLKRIVLDRVTFRNEIAIEQSAANHVPFRTDKTSLAELNAALAKLNPATQSLSATFVGVFETRAPLTDLSAGHGLTNGYGYMERAPGRLLLREVRDISIADKPASPRVLSVCELLATPLSFNGKLVAVKGSVMAYQGWWLYDDHCPSNITVQGRSFDNLIAITSPTDLVRVHDVSFDTDDDSVALITKALGNSATGQPRIIATFVGMFETRQDLSLVSQNGAFRGFGHLGAAPGQLLLKECRGVTPEYVPLR